MKHFVAKSTSLFPLWVILFSIWAFLDPQYWSNLNFLIVPLLSLVMFSMGLTLEFDDHFVNMPTIQFNSFVDFTVNKLNEKGQSVKQGFEYHSGTNSHFLNIEEIIVLNNVAGF